MKRTIVSAACTLGIIAGCGQESPSDQVASTVLGIYGGAAVGGADPIAKSTVALVSGSDYQTARALVDGSGTLVAPNILVGAAHTCLNFKPRYASFGPNPPDEQYGYSYDRYLGSSRYPLMRRITKCIAHPQYRGAPSGDEQISPVHDIAIFFVESTPPGFIPARVHAVNGTVPSLVTIAGFGAFENQFDNIQTSGMLAYELRKVDSFVSAVYPGSLQFMDGPNAGRGSCQGDSGGSVYARISAGQTPVLLGMPVSGPECDLGIGYNTDIRHFVSWIESTAGVTLTKATVANSCGNGTVEAGETCDGTSVQCTTLGSQYSGGLAPCNSSCSGYDASACAVAQAKCGNGIVDPGEACDGSSLACTTVDPRQFSGGQAVCKADCSGYGTLACAPAVPADSCTTSPCEATPNSAIPDNTATGLSSTIRVDNYSKTLDRIRVTTRIRHSYRGDLVVTLTSPTGTTKTLHNRSGGSADDLMLDLLLQDFARQAPAGTWTLKVTDRSKSDVGKLESWNLTLIASQPVK